MTLRLYHCPDWASTIILLSLEELGLPHEVRRVDPEAGDLADPAFLAVNPLGLLPAMETPEGPVFETAAILLWLDARHPGLGPPPGAADRAAFLSWLLFVANTLHPTVMALIHPDRPAGPAHAADAARTAFGRLAAQAGQLDRRVAGRAPRWLTPEMPALGHYIGVLLRWATFLPEDPALRFDLGPFPALAAMLSAHEGTPAALRVAALDGLGPTPYTDPRP